MKRLALAAGLMLAAASLSGCHRPQADQPTPGADGDAQAKAAAKTLADLQAADEAAQGPAPQIAPARAPKAEKAKPKVEEDAPAEDSGDTVETNAN